MKILQKQNVLKGQFTQKFKFCHHLQAVLNLYEYISSVEHKR